MQLFCPFLPAPSIDPTFQSCPFLKEEGIKCLSGCSTLHLLGLSSKPFGLYYFIFYVLACGYVQELGMVC